MTLWHNEKGFLLPTPARTPENKLKNKKKVFFFNLGYWKYLLHEQISVQPWECMAFDCSLELTSTILKKLKRKQQQGIC